MRFIKSLSIHYKLIMLMVTISISVLFISSFLFYQSQVDILENSAIENAESQAFLIGSSVESAIIFNDERAADKTLDLLKNNPVIESAAVVLPDKKMFAYYNKSKDNAAPEINFKFTKKIGEHSLEVIHKIMDGKNLLGYIYIQSNLDNLNDQQIYYTEILISVVFFSIILAYILASYFKKIITVPLDLMVQYVNDLSETKNYTKRLDINSDDELGTLADGFNLMLDAVQQRENELKEHGNRLQEIVDKRTEELYEKAHFDSLTNLPNRALLLERLNHAILAAARKKSRLAILFMDLDRFKVINDSLGHNVGDQLLIAVAKRLTKAGREIDTVARLGGDEFVFLLEEIAHPEDAARIARRIKDNFTRPIHLDNHVLYATTSIGISVYPEDGNTSQLLLKNADASMYHSKEKGPGNYTFYRDEMNNSSYERLEIENALRNAIANNEFYLVYQPQITVADNKIHNLEALIRWNNSTLGFITPDVFIPIAEEIGIINQIGTWVISQTCKQLDDWENHDIYDITIAINISASHLVGADLINHIKNETAKYNIEYDKLELEITEEVFLDHSERTIDVLKELQSLGLKIAIDDFGTGYSSLRYLKNLPVDTLKLDGMFIQDLQNNESSKGIVSSTIILAHSLNMKLVAECVETREQYEFLKQQNCDLVQGYYFHKPMKADELLNVISN